MALIRIFLLSKIGNALDCQTLKGGVKVFVALESGGQTVNGVTDLDLAESGGDRGFALFFHLDSLSDTRKDFKFFDVCVYRIE